MNKSFYLHCWALAISAGVGCTGCVSARYAKFRPENTYEPTELRSDFHLLQQILEADHPSLYFYTPKDSMDATFRQAYQDIQAPMTEGQFKNLVAKTIAHIRCGHTGVRSSRMAESYALRYPVSKFPFQCKVLTNQNGEQLALTFNPNQKDTLLIRGSLIKAINNMPAAAVIDSLKQYLSIDGASYNFAYQRISGNFPTYYQYTFGPQAWHSIDALSPDGKPIQERMIIRDVKKDPNAMQYEKAMKKESRTKETKQQRLYRIRHLDIDSTGKTAYLYMGSFSDGVKKKFIRRSFKTIQKQKIENLVIDLRSNTGGLINTAIYLAKYLKPEKFVFMDSVIAPTKKLAYKKYLQRHFIFQVGLTFLTHKGADGQYHFGHFEQTAYTPIKSNHFNGHVYLLTGGYTFSAASMFTANMKGTPNVTIVGEETGGANYGNNGVFISEITLPKTGVRVTLPLCRIVTNHTFPIDGRGVMPDIEISPTLDDIRAGIDPKLKKVAMLLKQPQTLSLK